MVIIPVKNSIGIISDFHLEFDKTISIIKDKPPGNGIVTQLKFHGFIQYPVQVPGYKLEFYAGDSGSRNSHNIIVNKTLLKLAVYPSQCFKRAFMAKSRMN